MPKLWRFVLIFVSVTIAFLTFKLIVHYWLKWAANYKVAYPLDYSKSITHQDQIEQCSIESASDNLLCLINDRYSSTNENVFQKTEALSSLTVALEMKQAGKIDKALKLFKHALALAPTHPDILTHYGEFMEETNEIVLADQLYFKALTNSPNHEKALQNRQRTANIVDDIDDMSLNEIEKKREILTSIPDSNAAMRRTKKEAYILNVFHTLAIEGNTMSLAETRSVLETRMAIGGKSIDEHNEIIGIDLAMQYLNSELVKRIGQINGDDILELHKRVMGPVDPIEAGRYRRTQVYVGSHLPPGPEKLTILMNQFTDWLNSESALEMHPIRYAAIAHYKLVFIHPFNDGNGRTSRLLMNMILMQSGYPPIIIPKQYRHKYYETLQMANEGDIRPFIRFIAQCTDLTLDMYLWTTSEHKGTVPALDQYNKDGQPMHSDDIQHDTIRLHSH